MQLDNIIDEKSRYTDSRIRLALVLYVYVVVSSYYLRINLTSQRGIIIHETLTGSSRGFDFETGAECK